MNDDFVPLENEHILNINQIMWDVWRPEPAKKAAIALSKLGYTSEQFWRFCKSKHAQLLPTDWTNNTYNELRNIENDRK